MNKMEAKILIVDDIEDNRYTLERSLKKDGYENIALAECGKEALNLVNESKFDLILLDLMMPEMNGFEFLEVYRSEFEKQAPVVVITGADLNDNDKKFLSSETSRVLEKSSMTDTGIADHLVETIESVAGVSK